MLEAIADFWKPVKKGQPQEKLQPEHLQVGSVIGFGFVPQAILNGRRLQVSAINTYQFGDEALNSFALTQDKDPGVSMIVAESDGEQYLAISRRVSIGDRMKLFESHDLDNVMNRVDVTRLACRENAPDYKGWVVASYKREIQGLKGRIFKGDFRKSPLPAPSEGQEFEYTLLVSDSNEHAIEIEKYKDGRIEVYATIYRRMNDVGEITHPVNELVRPDIKLASTPVEKPAEAPKAAPAEAEEAKPVPIKLQEFSAVTDAEPEAGAKEQPSAQEAAPANDTTPSTTITEEKSFAMATTESVINGASKYTNTAAAEAGKSKLLVQPTTPEHYLKQEVKAVTNNGAMSNYDADSIECDLRVANKIIDEAIRNEMRLTDIVRRIIELPVAYPEAVQIPITLTDEDYALLAIRYGIAAADRNAIKRRIIEDLNDFSGNSAKKAA